MRCDQQVGPLRRFENAVIAQPAAPLEQPQQTRRRRCVIDALHFAVHPVVGIIAASIRLDRRLLAGPAEQTTDRGAEYRAFLRGILRTGEEQADIVQVEDI